MLKDKVLLIVEDEEETREMLKEFFVMEGSFKEIIEAGDAKTAIQMISSKAPDIMYLDIGLGDGTEGKDMVLPEAIRNNNKCKIIVVSAYPEFEEECINAGAAAFLKKPLDLDDFVKACKK
jgi:YesN/AraC family two-component response regulator